MEAIHNHRAIWHIHLNNSDVRILLAGSINDKVERADGAPIVLYYDCKSNSYYVPITKDYGNYTLEASSMPTPSVLALFLRPRSNTR
ncbi:hypothetical protein MTP99_015136 [Tenebrio molitor]|nr:hypothetical protein MTP99_015136 [Tenebrio molitor]